MTQRQNETSKQTGTSAGPVAAGPGMTLPYQSAPVGAVVASEAALDAFRKTRSWALGFAVLLFTYAAVGGAVGVVWLVFLIRGFVAGPTPTRPFITVASVNLLFAPIALIGGLLAIRYYRAAGCAYWRRNSDDLERASITLKRLWLWAGASVIVLITFAAAMVVAAILTGEWPG